MKDRDPDSIRERICKEYFTKTMKTVARTMKTLTLSALALCLALILCACAGLPGSEDLDALTPTPELSTPTPTPTEAPTGPLTPVVSPSPTPVPPTPTPDISGLSDGWYNAMAYWDFNGKLVQTATVAPGEMLYANNFERDLGNRLSPDNVCNEAEIYTTDRMAYSGYYSVKVSRRKQEYHGLSGFGLKLSMNNGITFNKLVDHVICVRCMVYYEDEGFGAPEAIWFTAYDAYHTEMALDYVYNRKDGLKTLDKEGNPVMQEQERFVKCNSVRVPKGTWTECTFYVTVRASDAPAGCILIGTYDEAPNSVGLYCSYYIDDLTVTVLPRDRYPVADNARSQSVSTSADTQDGDPHVIEDIAQGPPVELPVPEEPDESDEEEAS